MYPCEQLLPGSVLQDPPEVFSDDGKLKVTLTLRGITGQPGQGRLCYVTPDGLQSPALHVLPGDEVTLKLQNQVYVAPTEPLDHMGSMPAGAAQDCIGGMVTPAATNLHFHGLFLPPVCHEDEVLHTLIANGASFVYKFRVPEDATPGLYWYHPHVHGSSEEQVQAGAAAPLIVDGALPAVAGLRRRILVLRDTPPKQEGHLRGASIPTWDVSLNGVPVTYPDYEPAVLLAHPHSREWWQVLNAAADTNFDLALMQAGKEEALQLLAFDGMPLRDPRRVRHVVLPPGGRVEFTWQTPEDGEKALLVTHTIDSGLLGDPLPERPLAEVRANAGVPEIAYTTRSRRLHARASHPSDGPIERRRTLYFSEDRLYPDDPKSPVRYYLTEEGQRPEVFAMHSAPRMQARVGATEEWTIENHSRELHDFHLHQFHFLVVAQDGVKLPAAEYRDTIALRPWDGKAARYPNVTIRVSFAGATAGTTILLHCHILEHEDAGMMSSLALISAPAARPGRRAGSQ